MEPDRAKTKAALEAEASLRYAVENSRRQEAEARERAAAYTQHQQALNNTVEFQDLAVPETQYRGPSTDFVAPVSHRSNNNQMDSDVAMRDARIAQLEAEVTQLRTSYSQRIPTQPMAMSNGFSAPGGADQTMFLDPSPRGSRGPSPRNSLGPSPRNSLRGPSPATPGDPAPATPGDPAPAARTGPRGAVVRGLTAWS